MVDMITTIATPILNLIVLFLGYASIGLAMIGLGIQLIYGIYFYLVLQTEIKCSTKI